MISTIHFFNRWIMPSLAAWAVVGVAAASELVVRDIGFDIELLPAPFSYSAEGSSTISGDDEFDRNIGIAIGCPYSFSGPGDAHGFLAAGELALSQATYGSVGHLTRYGLRASGGYGWAINDSFTVAAMAKLGYGMATFDLTANSAFPALSASGTTLTYGLMLSLDYVFSDRFVTGVRVGYLAMSDDLSGGGITLALDNAGAVVAFGIAYRFSNSPRPLE